MVDSVPTDDTLRPGSIGEEPGFDVFLSYNRRDKDVVDRIAVRLQRRRGSAMARQLESDPWSSRWQEETAEGLARSKSCAVFLGPHDVGGWGRLRGRSCHRPHHARPGIPRVSSCCLPGLGAVRPDHAAAVSAHADLGRLSERDSDDDRALQDLISAVKGMPFGPDVAVEPRHDVCPYRGLQRSSRRSTPSSSSGASATCSACSSS